MDEDAFQSKTDAFLKWFQAFPGATFHPQIEIIDLRSSDAGRGIIAKEDIPEDTTLFTIPRSAIINTLTSDLPNKLPKFFEESTTGIEGADNEADDEGDEAGPPDSWVSLILVMIYEYLQGDQSKWKPYFDVFPNQFNTLMFWSDAELDELQASAMVSKIGKDQAEGMFRTKILPAIAENPDMFYPDPSGALSEDQLITLAHRMGSTIMAYAFDLDKDDEDEENEDEWVEDKEGKTMLGMVPMADILNADARFNAHVNHGEESLTVISLRPIKAGEQILNYYGPLGNGDLLRRYGYVTDVHARHDAVEIPWQLVLSVLKEHLQLDDSAWGKTMNELDDEEIEDTFIIERDLDEPDEHGEPTGEPRLRHLPQDMEEQIKAFLKEVRKVSPDAIPDKRKRDEVSLAVMQKVFRVRLMQYATTHDQDLSLLADDTVTGRKRMATVVRSGEKALLQEAIQLANQRVASLNPEGEPAEEPSSKRQRSK